MTNKVEGSLRVYIIGIGGIGVSAIARYYNKKGYQVLGSDKTDSELIKKLQSEGIDIIIGEDCNRITEEFELIVYTEAIPENQKELKKAKELKIETLTYPQALAKITEDKKLIAVAGTHGKSTTSSLASIMMKESKFGVNSVVGTLLKEFDGKNAYFSESEYFVIEACEYKRSFLNYKPYIGIITNIEVDHLDYYKDEEDYISAYKSFIENIRPGGYVILNGEDKNCKKLLGLRDDIKYIEVYKDYFKTEKLEVSFRQLNMQVPGEHILFDAHLIYCLGSILEIDICNIILSLQSYTGVWRRMEIIGQTKNRNILISDYGHHPTEVSLTLGAVKEKYNNRQIITVFQPHQYNRTIELLEGFKNCFLNTDILIIPDIYESRDSINDKKKMSTEILLDNINHGNKYNGNGLDLTLSMINNYDNSKKGEYIIILMGAGNIDNLRYKIETH